MKKIALLATGDEIIQGDILNTNSQQTSSRLSEHNIRVGTHLAVGDNIQEIEQSIEFLLQTHQGLIITGGLGPTSDDLTRYALSNVIKKPLIFDEPTWEQICLRLKRFGYNILPESNRQQALFPDGGTIIPNPNGTAAGYSIEFQGKHIFMLPGPPTECLPMVDAIVIPTLIAAGFQQQCYRQKWMLFNVSEGKTAEELDSLVKSFDVKTGYRICHPYLEVKLFSFNQNDFIQANSLIEQTIKPHIIGNGQQFASEQAKHLIMQSKQLIGICDLATGGLLENLIKTPTTAEYLLFSTNIADFHNIPYLLITGLDEFWHKYDTYQTHLSLLYHNQQNTQNIHSTIPLREDRVKAYAAEWICQQLLRIM